MNSFRKLLAAACLVALTADLTAQTAWTGNTSNIYLNPLTGKVGIGTSSPTGKLHIVNDHSASGTPYGLYLTVTNNYSGAGNTYGMRSASTTGANNTGINYGIVSHATNNNTTSTSGTYGLYSNTTSKNKGQTFGYWANVDNTNTTSTAGVYGIQTTSKSSSSASTVYGIHATVSGGSKRWAGYFTGGDMWFSNKVFVGGSLRLGNVETGFNNYGQKLYFGLESENKDAIWMARYNQSADASVLRLNLGDDSGANDKFAIGTTHYSDKEWREHFTVSANGRVGIGTTTPYYKLDVSGIIRAHEIKINTSNTADFVFEEDYALRPLNEVSDFIQANKHLPEIPSAADMVANGVDMGELQIKLLQKIEELTLYVIEQDKQLKSQQEEINRLKKNNSF